VGEGFTGQRVGISCRLAANYSIQFRIVKKVFMVAVYPGYSVFGGHRFKDFRSNIADRPHVTFRNPDIIVEMGHLTHKTHA
jgi:hypothetical protein